MHYFKLQGWGFRDSGFKWDREAGAVKVLGSRYMFGGQHLPRFADFFKEHMDVDVNLEDPPQADMQVEPSQMNHGFIEELGTEQWSRRSFEKWERILHSHGADLESLWQLRYERLAKLVDMIVYPNSTEDCEHLVRCAAKHNVVLVPFGGGTNVTKALALPTGETRMIVSVDMERMNAIKWVDKENKMACIQAGVNGKDLERDLAQYGVTTGHEPDSQEFSTVGGWVSTRASGMKKNTYGNIEDLVCNVTLVTPKGTFTKPQLWPRQSNGPDLANVIMGSEGNMGIVTDVVLMVRPLPAKVLFESVILPDYETGIKFMHAVSKVRSIWPSSMRLVDNTQFQMGSSLKPASSGKWEDFIEAAKKFFVINIKGYHPEKLAACTMLFEGDANWVNSSH